MTDHLLALIATHLACADVAETRPMSWYEIRTCSAVLQDIRLNFVPDIDRLQYRTLTPQEKYAVDQRGSSAFEAWRAANPALVFHLEQVARGETELAVAA